MRLTPLLAFLATIAGTEVQAQQIILPCVPSGASCIPVSAANPLPTTGGSGGGITIGTTAITGGATTQVLFNLAGVVSSDSGLTYAGSSGAVAIAGGVTAASLVLPATGSATTTVLNFGTPGTGIFGTSNFIALTVSGATAISVQPGVFTINQSSTQLVTGANININSDTFLTRNAAATWRFGANADVAAPVAQTLGVQNVITGTSNTGGANFIINGSKSTGTGAGGKIILQTSLTGTTGSTVNSNFPMITINPGAATTATVQFGDGTNFTTYDSCTALTTGATGIIACTASAIRFKELFSPQALNIAGLDALRTDIAWKYKDDIGYGLDTNRVHVGLFADDVEKLDPRCVVYRNDGQLGDYEDRCVIAYLVADRKQLAKRVEALEGR